MTSVDRGLRIYDCRFSIYDLGKRVSKSEIVKKRIRELKLLRDIRTGGMTNTVIANNFE
jgi:hypothetical protein